VVESTVGSPLVMGIVNASPESFSDGRLVSTAERQVERAVGLVADGADLIDVGGESGVTGVAPLSAIDEIRRVLPVVEALVTAGIVVSVDTWKPEVARAVLEAGAHVINDVSGLRDQAIADLCAAAGAGLVVMHTRAAPKVKEFPDYDDVVADAVAFLREKTAVALGRGVPAGGLIIDPGPDFAKTPAQTIRILRSLPAFVELGFPTLLAVSRKDFIGAVTMRPPGERDPGSLAALAEGVDAGARIVRVHDVRAVRDYFLIRAVLRGEQQVDPDLMLSTELRREPTS
jgi:dihydropteroate synthase